MQDLTPVLSGEAYTTVIDPIFDSLWDATLWELWAEPGIWEPRRDVPNFLAGASEAEQVAEAETVLLRLHREGWAIFVRRPWDQTAYDSADDVVLTPQQVEAAIGSEGWRSWEWPPPEDMNIWLAPTEKWQRWREAMEAPAKPPS